MLYGKGTLIIMNECMNYAFIHALISHESSGTNTISTFFIHDLMDEQHLD